MIKFPKTPFALKPLLSLWLSVWKQLGLWISELVEVRAAQFLVKVLFLTFFLIEK